MLQQNEETPTPEITDEQLQQYKNQKSFEHNIHGETLQGLSLKYNITPESIRKFNNLTTNEIYHLKSILIPDKSSYNIEQLDENQFSKLILFTYFMNNVLDPQDRSEKIAKYYLEIAEWDLNLAIKEYQQDKQYDN